ncbi:TFIIH complex kinase subunit [Martiniozyma asiatica (nom. inval.)]|nr:TFIIH complex kinase subunit [Martiniozyma asiatica]
MALTHPMVPEKYPVPAITNTDIYKRSTQFRHWTFSKNEVEDLRTATHLKGEQSFQRRVEELKKDGNIKEEEIQDIEKFTLFTIEEEGKLVGYFTRKIEDLGRFFNLPLHTRLTAMSYLQRFFLKNSVMDYNPQELMYTCLFLACKAEDRFISLNKFTKDLPITNEIVTKYEWKLLESLGFSIKCWHAGRCVYGLYLDIQKILPQLAGTNPDKVDERLGKGYDRARKRVVDSEIIGIWNCTPSQVGLACWWLADNIITEKYIDKVYHGSEKLLNTIKDCANLISMLKEPTIEEIKYLTIKSAFCTNPIKGLKKMRKEEKKRIERLNSNIGVNHVNGKHKLDADELDGDNNNNNEVNDKRIKLE